MTDMFENDEDAVSLVSEDDEDMLGNFVGETGILECQPLACDADCSIPSSASPAIDLSEDMDDFVLLESENIDIRSTLDLTAVTVLETSTTLVSPQEPSTFGIMGLYWDAKFLQSGVFIVPDHDRDEGKAVEVRLRSAAASANPPWTIRDLLCYAVEHGFRFRIMVPLTAERTEHRDAISPPTTLEVQSRDLALLVKQWRYAVEKLLQARRSRAILFLGGIEARLAISIGGTPFLRSAGNGVDLTGHMYTTVTSDGQTLADDAVTADEIRLLLGYVALTPPQTTDRSLWPSSEILRSKCPASFDGDWNSRCENLFQNILSEVNSAKPQLRSRTQWGRFIRHGGFAVSSTPSSDSRLWAVEHEHLIDSTGCDWHGSGVPALL